MRVSLVRIWKLSPEVMKLLLQIITVSLGKKSSQSENYKLSVVEEPGIILFSDFSENYGDNLSKSFDIFSLKLPLKKVCHDVTNSNERLHKIRELRISVPSRTSMSNIRPAGRTRPVK